MKNKEREENDCHSSHNAFLSGSDEVPMSILRGFWQELVFPGTGTTAVAAITFFVYVLFIT